MWNNVGGTLVSGGGTGDSFAEYTNPIAGTVSVSVTADSTVSGLTSNTFTQDLQFNTRGVPPTAGTVFYTASTDNVRFADSTGTEPTGRYIRATLPVTIPATSLLNETSVTFRLNNASGTELANIQLGSGEDPLATMDSAVITRFSNTARTETIFYEIIDGISMQTTSGTFTFTWEEPDRISTSIGTRLDVEARATTDGTFNINSNGNWTASTTAPWITIDTPNGGPGVVPFQYDIAVSDGPARNGNIVFTNGSASVTVSVFQAAMGGGRVTAFRVTPTQVGNDGGLVDLIVDAEAGATWRLEIRTLTAQGGAPNFAQRFNGIGSDNISLDIPGITFMQQRVLEATVVPGFGTTLNASVGTVRISQTSQLF